VDTAVRREHELELLGGYYDHLTTGPDAIDETDYSWEQFILAYQIDSVSAFMQITTGLADMYPKAMAIQDPEARQHGMEVTELWAERGLMQLHDLNPWANYNALTEAISQIERDGSTSKLEKLVECKDPAVIGNLPQHLVKRPAAPTAAVKVATATTVSTPVAAEADETRKCKGWLL
jgi:hypothetical protein